MPKALRATLERLVERLLGRASSSAIFINLKVVRLKLKQYICGVTVSCNTLNEPDDYQMKGTATTDPEDNEALQPHPQGYTAYNFNSSGHD